MIKRGAKIRIVKMDTAGGMDWIIKLQQLNNSNNDYDMNESNIFFNSFSTSRTRLKHDSAL